MNAARKRRKARLLKKSQQRGGFVRALLEELEREAIEKEKSTASFTPEPSERFVWAFVSLKLGDPAENKVAVRLSENHLTRKISEMNANGFWVPGNLNATYIPPGQISKVEDRV